MTPDTTTEPCAPMLGYRKGPLHPLRRALALNLPNRSKFRARWARSVKTMHGEELLVALAYVARKGFGLTVWQWLPGHVGGHAPHSLHMQHYPDGVGKAFDAYGPAMADYARWCDRYAPQLDELIFNPDASRKNGQHVPSSYWGPPVWAEHRNHCHVGNDGPPLRRHR